MLASALQQHESVEIKYIYIYVYPPSWASLAPPPNPTALEHQSQCTRLKLSLLLMDQ